MADIKTPCSECGMPCTPSEFHPFAACLMFKASHSSEVVRANLDALAEANQAEVARLAAENFALAASQCPDGYGDEGGTPRCCAEKEIARLTRENEGLAKDAARLDFILKTNRGHFMNRTQDFQWFIDMPPEEARANIDAALAGASGAQITKDEHGKA